MSERHVANRVLLAAAMVVVVSPLIFFFMEKMNLFPNFMANPKLLVVAAVVIAVFADRAYLKLCKVGKPENESI